MVTCDNSTGGNRGCKEINVLILGKTGCGKSTLINRLVGEKVTDERPNLVSVTTVTGKFTKIETIAYGWIANTQVVVNYFDTRGFADTRRDPEDNDEKLIQEIKDYIGNGQVKIDKIIYCVNERRLDVEQFKNLYKKMGLNAKNKRLVTVVFTHRDTENDFERQQLRDGFFDSLNLTKEPCKAMIDPDVLVVTLSQSTSAKPKFDASLVSLKAKILDGKSSNMTVNELFP